jgi:hypothetical protein
MVTWGFCLFIAWMAFVIAIGIAFLVWGWKRGDFQLAHESERRLPKSLEPRPSLQRKEAIGIGGLIGSRLRDRRQRRGVAGTPTFRPIPNYIVLGIAFIAEGTSWMIALRKLLEK